MGGLSLQPRLPLAGFLSLQWLLLVAASAKKTYAISFARAFVQSLAHGRL